MLRRFWLFFAQAVTVVLAVWFVIATLKPDWLQRGKVAVQSGSPIVALKEVAPIGHGGTSSNSYAEAAKVAMPAVVNIFSSKNAPKRGSSPQASADPWFRFFFGDRAPEQRQEPTASLGSGVIVDESGMPVGDGTVGELLVRGIGVMAGYNKRERSETFDADGWYHTGDRVYRNAGDPRLFYVGRTSELIKTSGANVSPLEVEAVIGDFDEVAQCVVLGVDHPQRGEEVCAVLVPADGDLDMESLARRTRDVLSSYKVPTRWITASSADIPTLASGKLDRRALRAWVSEDLH